MASESSAVESRPPIRITSRRSDFHCLEIDYFKLKDLPVGQHVSSPKFNVGGFDWIVYFYPRGLRQTQGSLAVFYLYHASEAKDVITKYTFEVVAKTIKCPPIVIDAVAIFGGKNRSRGHVIARDQMESLIFENGTLVVSTSIKVLTEQKIVHSPHGLCEHIQNLWENGKRFDVTFDVEGESISAHKFMLAARSPVFEAKLFGPMAEVKMECIKIDEMEAEVFKALLEFIYTDRLPVNKSSDDDTLSIELLQGLFVAADRYALEKLTLLCVEELGNNLTVDTVATTLISADRHGHAELNNKCLDFVSDPEIFTLVALTEGYFDMNRGYPSLFSELSKKMKKSSRFADKFAKKKKQRTS